MPEFEGPSQEEQEFQARTEADIKAELAAESAARQGKWGEFTSPDTPGKDGGILYQKANGQDRLGQLSETDKLTIAERLERKELRESKNSDPYPEEQEQRKQELQQAPKRPFSDGELP